MVLLSVPVHVIAWSEMTYSVSSRTLNSTFSVAVPSVHRVTTLQTLRNSLTMCGTHAHVKWYS